MSVSADNFDKLSERIDEAKRRIRAAASENEAEVKAKVEEARKNADDHAAELSADTRRAADEAGAHWQQIRSDWERHRSGERRDPVCDPILHILRTLAGMLEERRVRLERDAFDEVRLLDDH